MDFAATVSQEELAAFRRDVHRHAESGLSEFWTTAFLAEKLSGAGYAVLLGDAISDAASRMGTPDAAVQRARLETARQQGASPAWLERMGGITGLVADVRPDLPTLTALRFDIDAVDVEESPEDAHFPAREGFASLNAGECHACAHDGHAAIGLGVALELARRRDRLRHNIRLIFQPGEEGVRGALPMVRAGVVDGVKYFLAAHIGVNATRDHELVCGTTGFLATTKFDVELTGRASHSGSEPHAGNNSLLAAASILLNLHAIPRHGLGDTRITVGRLSGGSGRNVIPSSAYMVCETRGATTEINDYMFEKAKTIIEHGAAMYDQQYRITIMGGTGCAASDPQAMRVIREAGEKSPYFHKELIRDMGRGYGSDDACAFLEAVQKQGGCGTYAQLGSALAAGHHNQRFDFNEAVLAPGVELFCRAALALDEIGA